MPHKPVIAVVAVAQNGVMGRNNQLPWKLPSDMRHFKETTTGGTIVMGRKTFESMRSKPLPNRQNIVVTRNPWVQDGVLFANSPEAAIAQAKQMDGNGIYLIGGAGLFEESLGLCDTILLTRVLADVDGDVFFPPLGAEWVLQETHPLATGPKDEFPCELEIYQRKAA